MDLSVGDIVSITFLSSVRKDSSNNREEKELYLTGIISNYEITKDFKFIYISYGDGPYDIKIELDTIIRIKKVDLPKAGKLSIKP